MKKLKKPWTPILKNASKHKSKQSFKKYLDGWGFQVWTRDLAGNKVNGIKFSKDF